MLSVVEEICLGLYTATVYLILSAKAKATPPSPPPPPKHKDWDHSGNVAECRASAPQTSPEHHNRVLKHILQAFIHQLNFMYCD